MQVIFFSISVTKAEFDLGMRKTGPVSLRFKIQKPSRHHHAFNLYLRHHTENAKHTRRSRHQKLKYRRSVERACKYSLTARCFMLFVILPAAPVCLPRSEKQDGSISKTPVPSEKKTATGFSEYPHNLSTDSCLASVFADRFVLSLGKSRHGLIAHFLSFFQFARG